MADKPLRVTITARGDKAKKEASKKKKPQKTDEVKADGTTDK